jgi:hypothetical protein
MEERVETEADVGMADTAQQHPEAPEESDWSRMTSQVERNVPRLREIATQVALMGPLIITVNDNFWGGVRGGC